MAGANVQEALPQRAGWPDHHRQGSILKDLAPRLCTLDVLVLSALIFAPVARCCGLWAQPASEVVVVTLVWITRVMQRMM